MREVYPRELFKYFREHGYILKNPWKGIYYIEGNIPFPTQVIVTKKLDEKAHTWLRALSESLKREDIEKLIGNIQHLTEIPDREMADSVLEVSLKANKQIVQELIGDDRMYETLIELMEPRLVLRDKTKIEEGVQRGLQKGIRGTVNALRKFGVKDTEIKMTIMENYELSEEDAEKYL